MGQPLETFCNKNLSIPFFFRVSTRNWQFIKKCKFLSYWCFLLSFCNKTMWMQDGILQTGLHKPIHPYTYQLWFSMIFYEIAWVWCQIGHMCMIINSLKKLVLGKYPLFETLLQLLIDVTVKYFLTISTIAKSINFMSHLFDFFSQHPIFITQVFYICRLNWCKVFT